MTDNNDNEQSGVRSRGGFEDDSHSTTPLDIVLVLGLCVLSGLTVGSLLLIWCGR